MPKIEIVLDDEGNPKKDDDGKIIIKQDWNVRIWNADSGEELRKLIMDEQIYHVDFFPVGEKIFIGTENSIEIWDVSLERQLERLDGYGHKTGRMHATLSPDGKKFLVIEQDTQTDPVNGRMTFGDGIVRIIDLERWVTPRPKIMDF
jgi:WD40 repeat protein